MPILYLHVGSHKTGTTAIQSFACQHRIDLLKQGLLYPDYPPVVERTNDAHHWFAHALAGDANLPLSPDRVPDLVDHWLRLATREEADVLVSAEALYRHVLGKGSYRDRRNAYLERLAETLHGFNVVPILVFRRPDDYIRSLYQERVMRAAQPYPEFSRFIASKHAGLRYRENADLIRDHFPRLRVYTYEELSDGRRLVQAFFETLGHNVSARRSSGVVRKSLTPQETRVKNYANRFLADRDASKRFVKWLHTGRVRRKIARAYPRQSYDLWTSHDQRVSFLEARQDDLAALKREYFPERETLFPPLLRGDTSPHVPEVPDKVRRMVDKYFAS
ncbi:MAG: hypothetical protein ACOC3H_01405 [bacterium]